MTTLQVDGAAWCHGVGGCDGVLQVTGEKSGADGAGVCAMQV
jgi:hypothetical protein